MKLVRRRKKRLKKDINENVENKVEKEVLYEENYNDVLLNELNNEIIENVRNDKTRKKPKFIIKRKKKMDSVNDEETSLNRNNVDIVWSEDKFPKK